MKIAFVGKGGSGKSTVACLTALDLMAQNKPVLLIDADLNIHTTSILKIEVDPQKEVSREENMLKIRRLLTGTNPRIKPTEFLKTTPPGLGSQILDLDPAKFQLAEYTTEIAPNGRLMVVGTYQEDGIGTSCYHGNLGILENILSHTLTKQNEWIVVDTVAGIDAFANSLYLQFDVLFFVCEPTAESVSVFFKYQELAREAGIENRLWAIGNKIEDEADAAFLKDKVGKSLIGLISKNKEIKTTRQQNQSLSASTLDKLDQQALRKMQQIAENSAVDPNDRLSELHQLHLKLVQQESITARFGDLASQIDQNFKFSAQ